MEIKEGPGQLLHTIFNSTWWFTGYCFTSRCIPYALFVGWSRRRSWRLTFHEVMYLRILFYYWCRFRYKRFLLLTSVKVTLFIYPFRRCFFLLRIQPPYWVWETGCYQRLERLCHFMVKSFSPQQAHRQMTSKQRYINVDSVGTTLFRRRLTMMCPLSKLKRTIMLTYVKVDSCYIGPSGLRERFIVMPIEEMKLL